MIFAGGDPSITAFGLAIAERRGGALPRVIELETIRTTTDLPDPERYHVIFNRVGRVIREHHVQLFAIEEQRGVQVGKWQRQQSEGVQIKADNTKTLIAVGAALGAAFAYGADVVFVQPQSVKVAVLGPGSRTASKEQVAARLEAMIRAAGIKRFSKDASDALAIAITGESKKRLSILKEGAGR